ncbi:MAG: cysteine desulfurase family protein [Myxococcota bacterium]|nr:cysteine desulfurase family protein [Myxococcota bacterium]
MAPRPPTTSDSPVPIYLDHHATTPLDERVLEAMDPYLRADFGNAASRTHVYGWRAEAAVEEARESVAAGLGAEAREIIFTSGATEANNIALLGSARARRGHDRTGIVTVATEHPAVLDPARALEAEGFRVDVLPVASNGLVDLEALRAAVDENTAVVSVMAANNEIGVLQPLAEIAAISREAGAWFHSDAAQAAGRIDLRVDRDPIDLLSISGHKLYGPKGVGVLYLRATRPRVRPHPILYGGGHERGLRSGTLPVAQCVGLARAFELCLEEREAETKRLEELRDALWSRIESELSGVRCNGVGAPRLAGNLNVAIEGVDADKLLLALPEFALSTGSACSSARPEPSHVLAALGLPDGLARASLRFGLGRSTTAADLKFAGDRLIEAVRMQRGE